MDCLLWKWVVERELFVLWRVSGGAARLPAPLWEGQAGRGARAGASSPSARPTPGPPPPSCLHVVRTMEQVSPSATWNIRNTIALIKHFHQTPCLWDANHPDYKRRAVKSEAYARIGAFFGVGAVHVESKIQALRNQFRREQRRLEDLIRSGVTPQRPKWFGYERLLFLSSQYQSRESRNAEAELFNHDFGFQVT